MAIRMTIMIVAFVFTILVCSVAGFASPPTGSGATKTESQPAAAGKTEEVPDVNTIVNKANLVAYYQGDDGRAHVRMTIINKQDQQRQPEFIILRKDVEDGRDQNYFIYFQRPADVRRMTYMVYKHVDPEKDDERWLYLPALSLVKRVAAGDKRTSFVGSHFFYEDVSGRSLTEDTHELIKVTDEFFVVKNVPKKPDSVEFSYYNVFIDRKTYMPVKMEYYDKNDKLYRTIEAEKIENIQDFPTPVRLVASDFKIGGKTIMEFTEVQYNIGLGDIFQERYLAAPPKEATK